MNSIKATRKAIINSANKGAIDSIRFVNMINARGLLSFESCAKGVSISKMAAVLGRVKGRIPDDIAITALPEANEMSGLMLNNEEIVCVWCNHTGNQHLLS
jgi:hypothetical protein